MQTASRFWQEQQIPLAPGLDETEVCRVCHRFGQPVSDDVLTLYSTIGGFGDYVFDEDFVFSLWPWDRLQEWNAEEPSRGIRFCDHLVGSALWEFRRDSPWHSSVWYIPT